MPAFEEDGAAAGRRQGGELTAGAGNGGHLRPAIADTEGPFPIRHNVNGPSNGNDSPCLPRKALGKGHRLK